MLWKISFFVFLYSNALNAENLPAQSQNINKAKSHQQSTVKDSPKVQGQEQASQSLSSQDQEQNSEDQVTYTKSEYVYARRYDHPTSETLGHMAFLYGLNIILYVATQPETVQNYGSFDNWKNNFGKIRFFDNDDPKFNWVLHPLSGSALYLYYRSFGYSRFRSFQLGALQSLLFEFTIEIYTESASFEDMFNTPVLGSFLGYSLERISLFMFNSNYKVINYLGYLFNPFAVFSHFEAFKKQEVPVTLTPNISKEYAGLNLRYEF